MSSNPNAWNQNSRITTEARDPYTSEYFVLRPISHDSRILMHTIATAENTAPGQLYRDGIN